MTPEERVEQTAIVAARAYAAANGMPENATAVGLVLAGMVVAAHTTAEAQQLIVRMYFAQHPAARHNIESWAQALAEDAQE